MQSLNHTIFIHTQHTQSILFIQVSFDSVKQISFSLRNEPNQIKRQLAEQPLDLSNRKIKIQKEKERSGALDFIHFINSVRGTPLEF